MESWAERIVEGDEGQWEELCEELAQARSDGDVARWRMGDIALRIETAYGAGSIEQAAAQAGVARSKLYSCRSMAAFYKREYRALVEEHMPGMTWSHMREAKRWTDDVEQALDVLQLAHHGTDDEPGPWTVERLRLEVSRRRGRNVPPMRVLLAAETTFDQLPALVQKLRAPANTRVRVRVEIAPD